MITTTFTDPQGALQTDSVFYVRIAYYNKREEEHYVLSPGDFTTVTNDPAVTIVSINCSFYYWVNAAAKATGSAPYILANSNQMDMDFNFTPDAAYDGLTLEAKCEKYLTDVVLPPMQTV